MQISNAVEREVPSAETPTAWASSGTATEGQPDLLPKLPHPGVPQASGASRAASRNTPSLSFRRAIFKLPSAHLGPKPLLP